MPSIGNPEWLTTVTFDEFDGGTKLTQVLLHASKENRDGHLQAGMEAGMHQSLDRLENELESMAGKPGIDEVIA